MSLSSNALRRVCALAACAMSLAASDSLKTASAAAGRSRAPSVAPETISCERRAVLCVGSKQEFLTIQEAARRVRPGDTVRVFPGTYAGFQVTTSGTASAPIVFKPASSDVVIDRGGRTGDGVRLQDVSYVVIDGFDIRDVPERCVAARGARADAPMYGNVIRNNTCTRSGSEGFYLSQFHSGTVENNSFTGCGRNIEFPHAIYLANSGSKNTVIRGNTVVDSHDIHVNGDASVEGADGIISGLLIEENRIWNPPHNGFNMDGVQDSTIRNNLVVGAGNSALRVYQIDAAAGPKNLTIYNNTFVSTRGRWPIKLTSDLGGHIIFNNILLTSAPDAGGLCTGSRVFRSGFNLATDGFSYDEEKSILDLARWRALGFDENSLLADSTPLFTGIEPQKYQLKEGAVAADAGAPAFAGVTAPERDGAGTARPQRRGIDIGAYELP